MKTNEELRKKGRMFIPMVLSLIFAWSMVQPAAGAPSAPLAQVIEGAKKEGTVAIKLVPGFTERSMSRLRKEIKDKYGVDLTIKLTTSTKMTNDVVEAIMERKAGAVPSYDLLTLSSHIASANEGGVLEQVDWKVLLSEGTNPNVVHESPQMRGGIVYQTSILGLMYHPEKVKASEAPKTLADLANPKWKGKAGIETSANSWLRWSFILGKEKVLSSLRAILKNGAIQGRYVDLVNRYLIGEIPVCTISSEFLKDIQDKGMPAVQQTLDFADIREYSSVVLKGAGHANAAKLIALHLASPEGARLLVEEAKSGTLHYPGNFQHDIRVQAQKQGVPEVFGDRRADLLEFYSSKEAAQLEKEITLVLQTGGTR